MTPVPPSVLRATFKKFLGEERYRKFLEAGSEGRLRYWQEQALMRFQAEHPNWRLTEVELTDALDVCPVHEDPLQTGFTESMDGIYFA